MVHKVFSQAAYADCLDLFDRALADPVGVRVPLESEGEGRHLNQRMNYFRVLDRERMAGVYSDPADPRHGISPYDDLRVSMPRKVDGKWYLYIQPRSKNLIKAESLGDAAE